MLPPTSPRGSSQAGAEGLRAETSSSGACALPNLSHSRRVRGSTLPQNQDQRLFDVALERLQELCADYTVDGTVIH